MARIEFKGFVQAHDNAKAPWTVVEGHSVKDDTTGKWVTKARTFHKVWLPQGMDALPVDELVTVTGVQKTNVREYQGEKKYDLVVYADTVTDRKGGPLAAGAPVVEAQGWAETTDYQDESPF